MILLRSGMSCGTPGGRSEGVGLESIAGEGLHLVETIYRPFGIIFTWWAGMGMGLVVNGRVTKQGIG